MAKKTNVKIDIADTDNLELPDGYELKKVKTKAEKIKELEDEITALESIPEPTDAELIELGRSFHPYTMALVDISYLKGQLKEK